MIRDVTAAGQNVSVGDGRATIEAVAPEGYGVLDAKARRRRGAQRKDKQRLKGVSLHLCVLASRLVACQKDAQSNSVAWRHPSPQCPLVPFPISTIPVARGVAHCLTVGISRG